MVSFKVNNKPATVTKTITFKNTASSSSSSKSSSSNKSSYTTSSPVSRSTSVPVPTQTISFSKNTPSASTVSSAKSTPAASSVSLSNLASVFNPKQEPAETTKSITFKTTDAKSAEPSTVTTPSVNLTALAESFNPSQPAKSIDQTISFKTIETPTPSSPVISSTLVASFNPTQEASAIDKTITFKTIGDATNNIPKAENSLLNAPAIVAPTTLSPDIQQTVESLVATANKAGATIANRIDNAWIASSAQTYKATAEDKIQAAYLKSLSAEHPAETFNSILQPQLSGVSAVANSAIDTITTRSGVVKKQNDADLSAALNSISGIVAKGLKTVKSPSSASNIEEAANAVINRISDLKSASDATINNDHSALMNAISNMVKRNGESIADKQLDIQTNFGSSAVKPLTPLGESTVVGWKTSPSAVVKMIVDNPEAGIDSLSQTIYRQIYGENDGATVHVMSERLSTIFNALKPYANDDGTMNSGKAQAAVSKLANKLVIQSTSDDISRAMASQGSGTVSATPGEMISVSSSGQVSTTPIGEAGAISTPATAEAGKKAEAEAAKKKSSSSSSSSPKPTGKSSSSSTEFKTPTSLADIDPTKNYKTRSGNVMPGNTITASDLPYITGFAGGELSSTSAIGASIASKGAASEASAFAGTGMTAEQMRDAADAEERAKKEAKAEESGTGEPTTSKTKSTTLKMDRVISTLSKAVGSAAMPESYRVISFTPAGFTSVKSSTGTSVKVDTDIYNELKKTGYSDNNIANGLASGKMGVTVDSSNKVRIGYVAEDPNNTVIDDTIFKVDPYKVITNEEGKSVSVPEWTYKKLEALGVSEKDMASMPQNTLNQMNSLDIGSNVKNAGDVESGLIGTTITAASQLPGERKVKSGLFSEVPLTAAQKKELESQTPNPAEHPLDYLLSSAVQLGEDAYTGLVKPQYKNGYTLEPTVAGLLKINSIGKDLAREGASINDVPVIEGLTKYETFTTVMQYADKDTLDKIAATNPRLILGASTDGAIQPIIEARMGDNYWDAIGASMNNAEFDQFYKEVTDSPDKPVGSILKDMLEGAGRATLLGTAETSNFHDMSEFEENQIGQLARELTIDPITPYPAVNAVLLPILAVDKTPITVVKSGETAAKLGKAAEEITLIRLGDGGITAMKDGAVLGKVTAKEGDATKKIFEIAGNDGSKIELKVNNNAITAVETVPAASPVTSQATLVFNKETATPAAGSLISAQDKITGVLKQTEAEKIPQETIKAVTSVTSTPVATKTTLGDVMNTLAASFNPNRELAQAERKITFETTPTSISKVKSADIVELEKQITKKTTAADVTKAASEGPVASVVTPEMITESTKAAASVAEYVPITGTDLQLTSLGDDVYRGMDGQKYVKYGKDQYLAVAEDYDPNSRSILAVQDVDEAGHASITREITGDVDRFHVTYQNADGVFKTVRVAAEDANDYDAIRKVLQLREDAAAMGIKVPDGISLNDLQNMKVGVPETSLSQADQIEQIKADMMKEIDDINARLDSEEAPSGDGGYSSGGSGGESSYTSGSSTSTTDVSQWTANADWGAEVRSLDGGKTWQVKDPETGTIYSTTEYEKVATARIEARRSKYDSETNTYKKQVWNSETKALDTLYQDSAGGWVSKSELDAERAAIAANNPSYVYSIDTSLNNARTRTLGDKVEYLDTDTGIWLDKDAYTTLKGSTETPIWNSEGGYYYFKKSDGSYEILNPYTNVRQTPEEYSAYMTSRNAASSAAVSSSPSYGTSYVEPASSYSYVTPSYSALETASNAATSAVESRAGGAEQVASAWDKFVNTPDYQKLVESGSEDDLQILAKAKNGESLTEKEISRAQYLRSQMSEEGKAALDAATGGDTSVALMSQNDFENLMRANADEIANMTDAEIKASGLTPEKEIFVHQLKAEGNMSKFFVTNDFQGASTDAQEIIKAEIGYYAGEPTTISNLLNKFNAEKSTWNLQTTQYWDNIVDSLKSSRNLLDEMPDWWKAENADYTVGELVMGKNKYSDLIVTVTRNPTSATMDAAYVQNLASGVVIGGEDGWSACAHTFKSEEGWIVKSKDGAYSFIRKNDFVTNADDAIAAVKSPLEMYFWEKPTGVTSNLRIPTDADGSQIVAVRKIDAMSMGESEWAGLTASGGLAKDMTKEYVAIDLISPSGIKWTTIREADKAASFKVGKYVDVIEQAPIQIAGKTGKDLQAMSATDFRKFVSDNALEIRNLGNEDLPYLTKYLDESRVSIVDDIRSAEITPVIETNTAIKTEVTDLEASLRDSFKEMDDQEFRKAVANNMDDIETSNLDNLELTPKQRSLIEAEIRDRNFIRDIASEFDAIDRRLAEAKESYNLKAITAEEYVDIVKGGIAQKRNIIDDAKDIQKTFDNRFKDVEPIACAASSSGASMGVKAATEASAASAIQLIDLAKLATPAAVATAVTLGANKLFGSKAPTAVVPTNATNNSTEQQSTPTETEVASQFPLTSLDQVDPEAYYLTQSGNTMQGKQISSNDLPFIVRQFSAEEINI